MFCKIVSLSKVYDCFSFWDICKKINSCNLLKSYKNAYRKSSAKRECHDENVFLKADGALSKLNFLFHLNWKRNLVNLRKWLITSSLISLNWFELQYQNIRNKLKCMRRAQDRARSARSRKNGARSATLKNSGARSATIEYYGARSATIESRALGALKLASDENVPAKRADFFILYTFLSMCVHFQGNLIFFLDK